MRELLARYAEGPARLRESLLGLTEADLRYQYDPAKWSIKEIAIHVADMDLVAAFRMKRVLAEEAPRYPGVDQDRWAANLGYQDREIEPSLQILEAVRHEMALLLSGQAAAAWERKGMHEVAGEQTLRRLVETYANHLDRHLEQIMNIRQKLGK